MDIVFTGVGAVSPIGVGNEAFWASLREGKSGVGRLTAFDICDTPYKLAAEVKDFDSKRWVKPRKSLKVMCRDIQFGVAAAEIARDDAQLDVEAVDRDRFGVVFGADMMHCELADVEMAYRRCTVDGRFDFSRWGAHALPEMFPLWMLKYLPNMPACHVAIGNDARGPNNTITLGEVSSLLAVAEAMRVLERGWADVMFTGGTGSRIHPTTWVRSVDFQMSRRNDDPTAALRPFDRDRDGMVNGEGAAAFVLETRRHAEARGARIRGQLLGYAARYQAPKFNGEPEPNHAIRSALRGALDSAGISPRDIGYVSADGRSMTVEDQVEAEAIREVLGDVPVLAAKGYFGNAGSGSGALELAVALLSYEHDLVPATPNYEIPDPRCQVNVIAKPQTSARKPVVCINRAWTGQVAAVVVGPA